MTRIGVTGHRDIPAAVISPVRSGIRAELSVRAAGAAPVEAFSSLAAGADQLFAAIALDCGIPVTAVIPGMDYERHFGGAQALESYRRLLRLCAGRVDLPYERTDDTAYYAAGRWIVDHADRMVAVWDGLPARGLGGTGDIVDYARRIGVPTTALWCPGVRR